ncbi:MAG: family transcriptional regulator, cyclic receptor protein [Candidatus Eremiobacteraeota bacterium]|jgi:CRP-like cAMP-binding protein|nr:family transcriptional regulator, cyclic receptor protein [Candidatus Eremiobacteraeota bacterium]
MTSEHDDAHPFDPAVFLNTARAPHSVRQYPPKGTVFSQGDVGDAVYYLRAGQVKLSHHSPQGKDAVLAIVGRGDFFGESCLGGDTTRMSTATAITASSVIRVEKDVMLRMLREQPRFSQLFIAHLLARNIRVEEDLVDQLFNPSEKRLARALLSLANFEHGDSAPVQIRQTTLAEMIGTTRSRVSFFMNKFRRLGYIEYNGGIRVKRSLLNVILHD